MDSLAGTEWDVVIVGTGLPESLLALSLSRSTLRMLHLDANDYYGGDEAALSLSEAETWAERHGQDDPSSTFSHASVAKAEVEADSQQPKLASSRAYSIALAPHLIYSRSNLISTIVSARIHTQLDFQAVGSWFVLDAASDGTSLVKVPGGREDVFADTTLDLKSKRSLMKFLRFVADYEEKSEMWQEDKATPFPAFLQSKFGLPEASLAPILALTMFESPPSEMPTEVALAKIARHARSIGTFGAGFGAVLPKWGGLAEITQVACRACAVGGGVYVLDKKVEGVNHQAGDYPIGLNLDGGEKITTRRLASSDRPMADTSREESRATGARSSKSISIVSSSLAKLFPPTSEGGVTPAGAVVVVPAASNSEPPVYVFAHTSEAGECPTGQCVLYGSVALLHDQGFPRLGQAISILLQGIDDNPRPVVLWSMRYEQAYPESSDTRQVENGVIELPPLSSSLALEDEVLDSVKAAWQKITGEDAEAFMKFEVRQGMGEEEEGG